MASWTLIPCLKCLFEEFDRIAPARDHASDGSIGNTVHQNEVSDHNADEVGSVPIHDADHVNEVHAIDVDNNLNEPDLTMEKVVQFLLARCRSGAERRLRYIIYNRRIWSASSDWVQKTYTGASAHTEHAHFSASYTTALEASTASWHLEDIPVAISDADMKTIENLIKTNSSNPGEVAAAVKVGTDAIEAALKASVDDFLSLPIGDKAHPARTVGDVLRDVAKMRGVLQGDEGDTANANMSPNSPLMRLLGVAADVDALIAAAVPPA